MNLFMRLLWNRTAKMAQYRQIVQRHFADINASIVPSEVSLYANELLQADLVTLSGHSVAISVTGLSPQDKISNLTGEAMRKINGQDKFDKFVEIIKTRNEDLASTLFSECSTQSTSQSTGK